MVLVLSFRRIFAGLIFLLSFWLLAVDVSLAAQVSLRSLKRLDSNRWQVILPLPRLVDYSVFELMKPDRIVIDILDRDIKAKSCSVRGGPIVHCRTGRVDGSRARFVLDVAAQMKVESASLEAVKSKKRTKKRSRAYLLKVIFTRADGARPQSRGKSLQPVKSVKGIKRIKNRVIIIDPGHGGENIGSSFSGVDEKDLMMTFARELRDQLAARAGFSVFLTRNEDKFVLLKNRVFLARRHHADVLISLHADWNADPKVKGFAVYSLSNRSADKYARVFIENEGAQIIGGEEWGNSLPSAHDILFDLTQRETLGKSIALGRSVLKQVRVFTPLLDQPHRFADLHMLSAPDLPAVLIEAGFLSNRGDMKKLMTKKWRRQLGQRIIKGLQDYFKQVHLAGLDEKH